MGLCVSAKLEDRIKVEVVGHEPLYVSIVEAKGSLYGMHFEGPKDFIVTRGISRNQFLDESKKDLYINPDSKGRKRRIYEPNKAGE